jgi:hypothetical protein
VLEETKKYERRGNGQHGSCRHVQSYRVVFPEEYFLADDGMGVESKGQNSVIEEEDRREKEKEWFYCLLSAGFEDYM